MNIDLPPGLCETQTVGPRTREYVIPHSACPSLGNSGISSVGISITQEGYRFVRLKPNRCILLLCTGGHGEVLVARQWHRSDQGTVYITPPNVPHAYQATAGSEWCFCWVDFKADDVHDWPTALVAPMLIRSDPNPLKRVIENLHQEYTAAGNLVIMDHLAHLVSLYSRRILEQWPSGDPLQRLWQLVDSDLSHPWTISELAELSQMSSEKLRLLCHQEMGRSPGKHLSYLRMQRAAYLLTTTSWTIEAVGHAVGYQDHFAFSTAFKRWLKVPPSVYRASNARG